MHGRNYVDAILNKTRVKRTSNSSWWRRSPRPTTTSTALTASRSRTARWRDRRRSWCRWRATSGSGRRDQCRSSRIFSSLPRYSISGGYFYHLAKKILVYYRHRTKIQRVSKKYLRPQKWYVFLGHPDPELLLENIFFRTTNSGKWLQTRSDLSKDSTVPIET